MIPIELSQKRIEGGYFLLRSVSPPPITWQIDTGRAEFFVGTYRDSGSPVRDALIELLRSAQKHIFIASFVLGDDLLVDEIVRAADRLQGGVYVITALDNQSLRRGLEEYGEEESIDSPEERKKNFERLTSRGVYVRGHESCHAKFAIADDCTALVGSANFVKNGFEWTGEANIIIRTSAEVLRLKRLFTQLWYEGCTFEIPPGVTYKVAQRTPQNSPVPLPTEQFTPGSIVWTNGPESTSLLKCIKDVINGARTRLTLSSYSIVGMQDNPGLLFNDIVGAARRGVEVSIFVRQRNAWPTQCAELNYLHSEGVNIYADLRNHAKVAIADGLEAVLFSANFDAKHGLNSGVEVGYRLSDANEIQQLITYMEHAINHADAKYLKNPTLSELDGTLAARWCSAWNMDSEAEVTGADSAMKHLNTSDTIPPVLYEEFNNGTIYIWCGVYQISGKNINGKFIGTLLDKPSEMCSADKLKSWMQSVRRNNNSDVVRRGFFAGSMLIG